MAWAATTAAEETETFISADTGHYIHIVIISQNSIYYNAIRIAVEITIVRGSFELTRGLRFFQRQY
jgi:hypothetical protein